MATLPLEAGISITFDARGEWIDPVEPRPPLDLVPALVGALSVYLANVAATANVLIARAQVTVRDQVDPDMVAAAIGVGHGDITTSLGTDGIAERLATVDALPHTTDLEGGLPVLLIFAGQEILTIYIADIQLREGSLIGTIRGFVRGHPFLSALIALGVPSAGTIALEDVLAARAEHHAIERALEGSRCRTEFNFRIDADEVRSLAAKQLNWETPPDGDSEHLVVCRLQFALRLAGKYPGPIDGIRGPLTMGALERFMAEQELSNYAPNSETVLGQLALDASRSRIRFSG